MSNLHCFLPRFLVVLAALLFSGCDADDTAQGRQNEQLRPNQIDTNDQLEREPLSQLTQEYARFRKAQISEPAYHLVLDLQAGSDSFHATATLDFELAADNTAPLTIDFDSGTISSLNVNGRTAEFDYEQWFISIPTSALKSGSNTVTINYQRPFTRDGAGLHKFTDPENGEEYLYTNFEPYAANRLFPHFDQPNLKAPLTLEVIAPADWLVIANTRESAVSTTGERKHWVFPATPPLSSYVYAMHAGPFALWESTAGEIPLRLFARSALAPYVDPAEWFVPTQQSFAFFQEYFGIAYPFGKYDQVIVPDFNPGAMENVAAVTFNERYISRGAKSITQLRSLASVIAHEMAHMWFGDLVTMDWWNGLWLNESFATYMANLALERASDFDNVWDSFYTASKLSAYSADQLITTHPVEVEVPGTADAFSNFDGITYGKGGSILKQLPWLIGEENFQAGVRNYLQKHAYGNTTLDDFVDELAAASATNLDEWKSQWLYGSGVNTVQADFTCENDTLTSLRLIQTVPSLATADKDLRTQRVQVGLYRFSDNAMQMTAALPVTYSGAVTWIPEATGQDCPDLVLPNEGDWGYLKIGLDNRSFATLNEHINEFSNPTTRIMLWQALWDSVQDGSLSMLQYVDFALANIGDEQDANVARLVSGHLGSTFNYFSRFGDHARHKALIEEFAFNQLEAAEAGSELQRIWYDSFVNLAHTQNALDDLLALHSGENTIDGIAIDQDKRWTIVVALNRYQHGPYEELLQGERVRDPSDQGNNMAIAAEAVRPDELSKATWFDVIINYPERYKLASLRSAMAYLFPAEQLHLMEAYRDQILAALPVLDRSATPEFLGAFTSYFDTALCTPESVARLAQANADFAGLQALVVKRFLVHHQQDERCVHMKSVLQ